MVLPASLGSEVLLCSFCLSILLLVLRVTSFGCFDTITSISAPLSVVCRTVTAVFPTREKQRGQLARTVDLGLGSGGSDKMSRAPRLHLKSCVYKSRVGILH